MIRKLIVLFLAAIIITFCFSIVTLANDRARVSVLEFSSGPDVDDEYKIAAANKLTKILFTFKRFDMIERTEIDRILDEQKFQNTGLVDQDQAVEIGKLLNIDYAFIGHIDHLSATYKRSNYDASAKITIKIIDIRSGKLLHIIEADGASTDLKVQTALFAALDGCFTEKIVFELRNTFAPFSSIFKVEKDYIYIANGANIGMKNGIRYRILRPEKTSDPIVNIADTFTTEIGYAEVVQVTETKAKAKILSKKEPIVEGDLVQELSADEDIIVEEPAPTPEPGSETVQTVEEQPVVEITPVPEKEVTPDETNPEKEKVEPQNSGAWVNSVIMRMVDHGYYGSTLIFEDRIGYESQSLGTSVGLNFGFGFRDYLMLNTGLEIGQDIPVIRNFLHLNVSATGGLIMNESYWDTSFDFYLVGAAGARIFLIGFKGLRLQYDLLFQFAGYSCYPKLGSRMTLGFCL